MTLQYTGEASDYFVLTIQWPAVLPKDDASVRKAFGRLLRSANLNTETFSSAEEFLSNPRNKENACIIIDIGMPGLTGFDLLERLSETEVVKWWNNGVMQ